MSNVILLTGGSGTVGTAIKQLLTAKGFLVKNLSRNPKHKNDFLWDIDKQFIDLTAFDGVETIINLAGSSIANGNWSKEHKQQIYNSRIGSTQLLVNTIKQNNIKIKHFISTSAIGIYGQQALQTKEDSKLGSDFLAQVCTDWELQAQVLSQQGVKVSIVRVGIVLDKKSGFLPAVSVGKWARVFPTTGSASNWVSWIHIADLATMYAQLATNELTAGIYNGTAPMPVQQAEFMKTLANAHGGGLVFNVPGAMLKMVLGSKSQLALANQQVFPTHALEQGFLFSFSTIQSALLDLC